MDNKQFRELASHAAKGTVPQTNFSISQVNQAFADELNSRIKSTNDFMRNKYDIFEIMIEQIDEVVPSRVIDFMSAFAEVRQIADNEKTIFVDRKSLGRNRAKKFITRVALDGVYETFRLDKGEFELPTYAIGGGITIDFDRMRTGAETLSELMEVLTEGLTDAIFLEVQKALRSAYAAVGVTVPTANRVSATAFDAEKMAKLIYIVQSYNGGIGRGAGAVIMAPPEFIAAMGPDAIVAPIAGSSTNYGGVVGVYHPDDINAIHQTGYIKLFRGTPIVPIPQSYTDETNTATTIDPQMAYVLPTGGEKVVKVVLEGGTEMWDNNNRDRSIEIMAYRKMGVGIHAYSNWCIFKNTGITQTIA